jgi:hypothetical protein
VWLVGFNIPKWYVITACIAALVLAFALGLTIGLYITVSGLAPWKVSG